MTEFYVELQDRDGTCYVATVQGSVATIYFEDLDDARMYAKNQVGEQYVLARVIKAGRGRVVDFFQK